MDNGKAKENQCAGWHKTIIRINHIIKVPTQELIHENKINVNENINRDV